MQTSEQETSSVSWKGGSKEGGSRKNGRNVLIITLKIGKADIKKKKALLNLKISIVPNLWKWTLSQTGIFSIQEFKKVFFL